MASPLQFMNYRCSFCMQAMGDGKGTLLHAVVRELVFYIPFMYILDALFGINGGSLLSFFGSIFGAKNIGDMSELTLLTGIFELITPLVTVFVTAIRDFFK